ncbi:MAG TPA: RNA polymerase factor sigma-54 [Edaphocola sp.]|nr:RNA polymerase factor sigma-54 [Edaphocola sp.]
MIKLTQSQKLQQKLSPQQIQYFQLLQVPSDNLNEAIEEELESNPALEIDNSAPSKTEEADNYYSDDDDKNSDASPEETTELTDYLRDEHESLSEYHLKENNDDEEDNFEMPIKQESTFHDFLMGQIGLLSLEDHEQIIAEQIIGSISDDGYLRRDIASISDDLAFGSNIIVSEKAVKEVLKKVQTLEPAGVGAMDLKECLLLQLSRIESSKTLQIAKEIIEKYFDEFSKKQFEKISNQLNINEQELKDANQLILKLTPKPGSAFHDSSRDSIFIIPDFFVVNKNGVLELSLNSRNAPPLKVSSDYKNMLSNFQKESKLDKSQKEAVAFIKQKIESANWFIDAIRQRQHTLLKTMKAILDLQKDYFLNGNESLLKPMILKDIADKIDMDISTVSRVANSKYVQTEFGTFLLKQFFSESFTTESGDEVSTYQVKNLLKKIVDEEDKKEPLSDELLMEVLEENGFKLARRTISKYREQLKIPVARLRKEA